MVGVDTVSLLESGQQVGQHVPQLEGVELTQRMQGR